MSNYDEIVVVLKSGVVNSYRVKNLHHIHLLHNGKLNFIIHNLEELEDLSEENVKYNNPVVSESIKDFNAVYYNGVQIVYKGRVCY